MFLIPIVVRHQLNLSVKPLNGLHSNCVCYPDTPYPQHYGYVMTDVNFLISPPAITESPAVESFVYKYTNVILAFPHVYQGQNLSQMSQYVDVKYIFIRYKN